MAARGNQSKAAHDVFPFGAVGPYAAPVDLTRQQVRDLMRHGARHKSVFILAQQNIIKTNVIRRILRGASGATAQVECDARGGKVAPEKLARLGECFGEFGDCFDAVLHGKDLSR